MVPQAGVSALGVYGRDVGSARGSGKQKEMRGVERTGIPTSAPYDECRKRAMPSSRADHSHFHGMLGDRRVLEEHRFRWSPAWRGVNSVLEHPSPRPKERRGPMRPAIGRSGPEAAPTRLGFGCSVGARVPWTNTRPRGRMEAALP